MSNKVTVAQKYLFGLGMALKEIYLANSTRFIFRE